jgi:hypothetical protein
VDTGFLCNKSALFGGKDERKALYIYVYKFILSFFRETTSFIAASGPETLLAF